MVGGAAAEEDSSFPTRVSLAHQDGCHPILTISKAELQAVHVVSGSLNPNLRNEAVGLSVFRYLVSYKQS
jgi:hypothetical protein